MELIFIRGKIEVSFLSSSSSSSLSLIMIIIIKIVIIIIIVHFSRIKKTFLNDD